MPSQSFLEMRRRNAISIVSLLRTEGELSRVELARRANLSPATVSSIAEDLLSSGVVAETGSRSTERGRPSIGLVFNPEARLIAGLSFGDTRVHLVLCDLDGEVLLETSEDYRRLGKHSSLANNLADLIKSLLKRASAKLNKLGTIGIAVPGPLSIENGKLIASTSDDSIDYAKLFRDLQRLLKRTVVFDSNTNLAALAESTCGAARGADLAVTIRVGHQVRSALVLGTNIVVGQAGLAGEIGHIPVPDNKERCRCGKVGCINTLAASTQFLEACKRNGSKPKSVEDAVDRALRGDKACREAVKEAARAVGYAVALFLNTLAPPVIVVSGSLLESGDIFTTAMTGAVEQYALEENRRKCILRTGRLGQQAEALGAAFKALASDPVLE